MVLKSKVKEVVYFKKLKAIKQLVLLLDLSQGDMDDVDNIPEDLRYDFFRVFDKQRGSLKFGFQHFGNKEDNLHPKNAVT